MDRRIIRRIFWWFIRRIFRRIIRWSRRVVATHPGASSAGGLGLAFVPAGRPTAAADRVVEAAADRVVAAAADRVVAAAADRLVAAVADRYRTRPPFTLLLPLRGCTVFPWERLRLTSHPWFNRLTRYSRRSHQRNCCQPCCSNATAPSRSIVDNSRYEASKPVAEAEPAIEEDAALLTVAVPSEQAKVTVNGHSTSSSGTVRQFMSRGLKDGFVYTYVVKVDYEADGKFITDSKQVKLRRGKTERLEFEPPAVEEEPEAEDVTETEQPQKLTTVVKLIVPADAEVSLAGNKTAGSGEIRTFRTSFLKPGEQWSDYKVQVTAEIAGKSVTQGTYHRRCRRLHERTEVRLCWWGYGRTAVVDRHDLLKNEAASFGVRLFLLTDIQWR